MIIDTLDIEYCTYDIEKLEIFIEMHNTSFYIECYDQDEMYRKYDFIQWNRERAFFIDIDKDDNIKTVAPSD